MANGRVTNKLTARWDKKEQDVSIDWPYQWDGKNHSPDGHLLWNVIGNERHRVDMNNQANRFGIWDPSFLSELKKRGYDITTLKFSIQLKGPKTA